MGSYKDLRSIHHLNAKSGISKASSASDENNDVS